MTEVSGLPIFIGHNDTLLSLYLPERGQGRSFFTRSDVGHIDLPRAKEGSMTGGFFAIFAPPDPLIQPLGRDEVIKTGTGYDVPLASSIEQVYAQRVTIAMMSLLLKIERESDGQVKVIHTIDDLAMCLMRLLTGCRLDFLVLLIPGLD